MLRKAALFMLLLFPTPAFAYQTGGTGSGSGALDPVASAVILGIVALGVLQSIGVIIWQHRLRDKYRALPTTGLEAEARIVQCTTQNRNGRRFVQINYVFPTTAGEAKSSFTLQQTQENEARFTVGSNHSIVYLPDTPAVSVFKADMEKQIKGRESVCRLMTIAMINGSILFIATWCLMLWGGRVQWPF